MGRKNKLDIIIKNMDIIKKLKAQGATDVQIAKHIGVCPATFYKYLKENQELKEALEEGKAELVGDLVGHLIKMAKGNITVKTTKIIEKNDEVITETTTKELPPNLGALIFALKNYDPDNFTNEPRMLQLKQRELELKEKTVNDNIWWSE